MEKINKNFTNGITLIALVITIIVLLILAGVSIAMLTGDNGVITNAQKSKLSSTFSAYKEEVELYKANKYTENRNFLRSTLEASKTSLTYNTKNQQEEGNIKTIITTMTEVDMEKFEIIKGKLLIKTKDVKEIKVAQSLGIEVNPYDITEDGELQSSDGNLLLVDETGTLKIPDTVTKIGEGAFSNTSLDGIPLKKIIIPKSVKEIGTNAFAYNSTLEEVEIEDGVEIVGAGAFKDCISLKKITFPDSVTKIGEYCMNGCKNLRSMRFSPNITRIERNLLQNCFSLEQIEIPEKVTSIDSYAFSSCTGVKEIIIPASVTRNC